MSDNFYIKKVLSGSTEEFRYFIRTYKDMAFSVAVSVVKDEFAAEEVVQDAFFKAFKNLKSFKEKSKFKTWFYRIVVNESFLRLRKTDKDFLRFDENIGDKNVDIIETYDSVNEDEQHYAVNEALKLISPKESLVLRLFYLEENSIKDVCEITNWSESNVKVLLHRARINMKAAVAKLLKKEVKKAPPNLPKGEESKNNYFSTFIL